MPTEGPWTTDCSGAIYAMVDGVEVKIGKMYSQADAEFVCGMTKSET